MTAIPTGPIHSEPYDAIATPQSSADGLRGDEWRAAYRAAKHDALLDALSGVELGAYDRRIVEWLASYEPSTVAVICSWIERARVHGAHDLIDPQTSAGAADAPAAPASNPNPHEENQS